MIRIALIALITIILVGGTLCLLTYQPYQGDTVELAGRILCQNNQKRIYSAVVNYLGEYATVPSDLAALVKHRYVQEEDLYCPASAFDPNSRRPYEYFPQNLGDPNSPLICENIDNHSGQKLRLKKLRPVTIRIMGDGRVVTEEINKKN